MTDTHSSAPVWSAACRIAVGLALATLLQGCVAGLPQRRPGSNVTVPRAAGTEFLDQLLGGCDAETQSKQPRARDVVECRRNRGDTTGVRTPMPVGPAKIP
jgi:hypothetical protein